MDVSSNLEKQALPQKQDIDTNKQSFPRSKIVLEIDRSPCQS